MLLYIFDSGKIHTHLGMRRREGDRLVLADLLLLVVHPRS